MRGAKMKIINAQQAKLNYKNTKLKLVKWSDFKCFNVKKKFVCALVGVLIK